MFRKYIKKILGARINGSYTFEAVFVFTIVLMTIIGILYLAFYVHDLCVLESEASKEFEIWINDDRNPKEKKWKSDFVEDVNSKLIIYRIRDIKTEEKIESIGLLLRYDICISWNFLKKILMNGKNEKEILIEADKLKAAKRMWLYGEK